MKKVISLALCALLLCGCATQADPETTAAETPPEISATATDADSARRFYPANVYDVTEDYIFAVGNPVWNSKK